jgi:adenylate kinase family enzyme
MLDGFPRSESQAVLLDAALAEAGEQLTLVVNLAVPDEVILDRIKSLSRRDFSASLAPFLMVLLEFEQTDGFTLRLVGTGLEEKEIDEIRG